MARSPDRILDELLVLKCQDGDDEALRKLVARWHGRLRRHAWYLTQDSEAAADIVQEAWLDMIRSLHRLKEPAAFRGWAYRIVGNKAADWIRGKQRQRELVRDVGDHQRSIIESSSPETDENTQALLRQSIRALPMNSRLVLSMKYLDRMSLREIAGALDLPVGTIKSRLHHAREQLKQTLERTDS